MTCCNTEVASCTEMCHSNLEPADLCAGQMLSDLMGYNAPWKCHGSLIVDFFFLEFTCVALMRLRLQLGPISAEAPIKREK